MLVIRNKDSIFLPIYIRFGEIFLAHGYFIPLLTEPTLKSKACFKCLYLTKIIPDLCRCLEYFSYLYIINQTEKLCLERQIRILS